MANAKHQIFISSTYSDLVEERQQLFISTYRMSHIPIGMEGFVASNISQWEYIKRRINECDYFVLVLAHRYGSLIPDGSERSFTEAEYDLATELGKPILRFILKDSAQWPGDESHRDRDHQAQDRLRSFKKKLSGNHLLAYWEDKSSLEAAYAQALQNLIRDEPRGGLFPEHAHPGLQDMGLRQVDSNSKFADHLAILKSLGPVTIVLNDGYHFIKKYAPAIANRVHTGRVTNVLLIHPESRNIDLVARKSNKETSQQSNDIRSSVAVLKGIAQADPTRLLLQCRGHQYFNNYSASLSTEEAIVSLYFTRIRSADLTTMRLTNARGGLYHRYAEDIDQLWREVESLPEADLLA